QVADAVEQLGGSSARLYWGSIAISSGLGFYLRDASPLDMDPLSPAGRAEIDTKGLVIVCLSEDEHCQGMGRLIAGEGVPTTSLTFTRHFLGFAGPPSTYRILVVRAKTPE